jgi:hypothetical protein
MIYYILLHIKNLIKDILNIYHINQEKKHNCILNIWSAQGPRSMDHSSVAYLYTYHV